MQRQLLDLAGPNARIRVDSFEGAQLPAKSQIKSIHITRDQYAAESHYIGGTFIEIITQPGMGPLRAGVNMNYHDGNMSGRNAFTPVKGPEAFRRYGTNVGGTIAKQRASFSLNFSGSNDFTTPILHAQTLTGTQAGNIDIRQPRTSYNAGGYLDYALTKDQTLRLSVNGGTNRLLERGQELQRDAAGSRADQAPVLHQLAHVSARQRVNQPLADRGADDSRP